MDARMTQTHASKTGVGSASLKVPNPPPQLNDEWWYMVCIFKHLPLDVIVLASLYKFELKASQLKADIIYTAGENKEKLMLSRIVFSDST